MSWKSFPVYTSSFRLNDLIKGGMEMLSPERVEGEESVSGSIFAQCSTWAVYLLEPFPMEATATVLQRRKLSLRKDSWLHSWAELNTQVVSYRRGQSGPGRDDARWLLRLCHLINEASAFIQSCRLVYLLPESRPVTWHFLGHFTLFPFKVCFVLKRRLSCIFFILIFLYKYSFLLMNNLFSEAHGVF